MTKAKRVIKAGLMNFWRNSWLSLATVLIVVVTLFTIGSVIFARAILFSTLDTIKDKVDISVYFKTDADESDILAFRDNLTKMDEVKNIEYISSEKALEDFRGRHKDNALIIQSLEELEENPLGAALNVKTKDPSQYAGIAKFLENKLAAEGISSIIDKVNYKQNKIVIDRLSRILESSKQIGFGISIVLVIISVLVTFNTIRMAIYTGKEEIKIMRLVGASNRFIRGPFIVEGMMYGLISSIITILLFLPFTYWLGPKTESFFGGINLYKYYMANIVEIFFILLFTGLVLGIVSSFIAVRRYLRG